MIFEHCLFVFFYIIFVTLINNVWTISWNSICVQHVCKHIQEMSTNKQTTQKTIPQGPKHVCPCSWPVNPSRVRTQPPMKYNWKKHWAQPQFVCRGSAGVPREYHRLARLCLEVARESSYRLYGYEAGCIPPYQPIHIDHGALPSSNREINRQPWLQHQPVFGFRFLFQF
jgi:hypothetical protein